MRPARPLAVFACGALVILMCAAMVACTVAVEGLVKLVGNEPFTKLVLVLDDGRILELRGALVDRLRGLSGRRLRLSGVVSDGPGRPGMPATMEVESIIKVLD